MRTRTLTVSEAQAGRTVESLLENELQLSHGLVSRLKRRENGVLLSGERVYVTRRVQAGDVLTAEVGDLPARRAEPIAFPLSILYEDEDFLLLDKPAGVTVHATTRELGACTLENALSFYLPEDASPHPVSRLDRGTTGVITFAKSGYAHELLKRLLHTPAFTRTYLGIAVAAPEPPCGVIDRPIGLYPGSTYRRAVTADGASSVTEYETLEIVNGLALLRLTPRTGRTHQLRVHLASIGCPLAGDWLYGTENRALIPRPALHSHQVFLLHPLTGVPVAVTAPLPADMQRLLAVTDAP